MLRLRLLRLHISSAFLYLSRHHRLTYLHHLFILPSPSISSATSVHQLVLSSSCRVFVFFASTFHQLFFSYLNITACLVFITSLSSLHHPSIFATSVHQLVLSSLCRVFVLFASLFLYLSLTLSCLHLLFIFLASSFCTSFATVLRHLFSVSGLRPLSVHASSLFLYLPQTHCPSSCPSRQLLISFA